MPFDRRFCAPWQVQVARHTSQLSRIIRVARAMSKTESRKVGEGVFEQDGVSEQGTAFRLHAVEQLPFLYAVNTRVIVQTDTNSRERNRGPGLYSEKYGIYIYIRTYISNPT